MKTRREFRRLVLRRVRPWAGLLVLGAIAPVWGQQAAEPPIRSERPGEHDTRVPSIPALAVPPAALDFADPSIRELAARIVSGDADLRQLRAWHRLSLLYAPFQEAPPSGWRNRALESGDAISIERLAAERIERSQPMAPLATYSWASLGPTSYNVGGTDLAQGRASCLWVKPADATTLFVGFADGGIWKTSNGGSAWTPLTDFQSTTAIGSLDVLVRTDTSTLTDAIIYAGTGEGNTAGDSVDGAGVLKSTNGGSTWALQSIPWAGPDAATNARWRHSIRRILIDGGVAGGQSVWAAGDGGVYRTTDGGTNWSLVTTLPYTGKPGVGGCWQELATDLWIDDSVSPSRVFAAFGSRSNTSAYAVLSCTGVANDTSVRANNGVYRSLDGGSSWSRIGGSGGNGFPAAPGQVGRIALLGAPSDKKQVYALISCVTNGATTCPNGQFSSLGIFRTADASAASVTWTAGSTTNFCSTQGWYDLTGAVDPTNPAKLFVGGLDTYLSTNSGGSLTSKSSWTGSGTSFVHADLHAMVFSGASTIFAVGDGGVFRGTITGGTTVSWANLNAGGLSTLQFYGIGQHPTTAGRIHGGLQDNGEAYTATGATWSETAGGDGGFSATDWSNGNNAYEEYVFGGISRSTTGGASGWSCIQNFGGCSGCGSSCVPDGQTAFIAPMTLDANTASTMYTGSTFVYRNSAAPTGSTWTAISPDLVGTPYDYILNVHSAPNGGVSGTLWATTLNGRVWITTNGGTNWLDTTQPPTPINPVLPNRAAPWIATHPANGRRAIVVYSGWSGSGGPPGHVFRTLDGGSSWTDISGALPDEPVFTVAVDPARPNDVYVGTEYGVYVNADGWGGSTWVRINGGQLPNVHVNQLEFSRANGKLRAATHGRGIWELTVGCASIGAPNLTSATINGCDVALAWSAGSPAGATYDVYRANGTCAATDFQLVASGVSGTSYLDTGLTTGQSYAYKISSAEASGSCEGPKSGCQTVSVPGGCPCRVAPTFGGLTSVTATSGGTCSLSLAWSAATANCAGAAPVYNVYRSTSPSFALTPANRIATCISATSYLDSGDLQPGTTYTYAVRAEDAAGPGNGPCRAGNVDANLIRLSGTPTGPLVATTFFDGAEATPSMATGGLWSVKPTRSHSGAQSFFVDGAPVSTCSDLVSPSMTLGPSGSPSVLTFWSWRDNLESTWDGGIVEVSTNGGASWTKLAISPTYPTTFDVGSTSCARTSQAPSGIGFSGNDAAWQGAYAFTFSGVWANAVARVRFRFGTDGAQASTGWYVDDIQVTNVLMPSTCATGAGNASEVSAVAAVVPLQVVKEGAALRLRFEEIAGAGGYDVYRGTLGSFYSHGSGGESCGAPATLVSGARELVIANPAEANVYWLVTMYGTREGPSGYSSSNVEIPPSQSICSP